MTGNNAMIIASMTPTRLQRTGDLRSVRAMILLGDCLDLLGFVVVLTCFGFVCGLRMDDVLVADAPKDGWLGTSPFPDLDHHRHTLPNCLDGGTYQRYWTVPRFVPRYLSSKLFDRSQPGLTGTRAKTPSPCSAVTRRGPVTPLFLREKCSSVLQLANGGDAERYLYYGTSMN